MLPLYDLTLMYHQPDHLTPPDPAERIAMAQIARPKLRMNKVVSALFRAMPANWFAARKA